jgi:acyl-CoA synthetase (AMP-forming)/AMP-acid ligase II
VQVTQESFIDGGFFKTGDTVTVDEDGYFVILGRKYIMSLQYHVLLHACCFHFDHDIMLTVQPHLY